MVQKGEIGAALAFPIGTPWDFPPIWIPAVFGGVRVAFAIGALAVVAVVAVGAVVAVAVALGCSRGACIGRGISGAGVLLGYPKVDELLGTLGALKVPLLEMPLGEVLELGDVTDLGVVGLGSEDLDWANGPEFAAKAFRSLVHWLEPKRDWGEFLQRRLEFQMKVVIFFPKIRSKVEKDFDFIRDWKITISEFWHLETLRFEHLKTGSFEYPKLPKFMNFKALQHFTHCFTILAVIKLHNLKQI